MNTEKFGEGDIISIELVNNSPTKKAVILNQGEVVIENNRERLRLLVELDGKQKMYYPNRTTIKNLHHTCGKESMDWVGKYLLMSVGTINNKQAIIGTLVTPHPV